MPPLRNPIIKSVFLFTASILVAGITGIVSLFMYQNIIILAQDIDYQLYQASNAPKQLINSLQETNISNVRKEQSNLLANASKQPTKNTIIGPSLVSLNSTSTNRFYTDNEAHSSSKNHPHSPQVNPNIQWIVIPKIGVNTQILTQGTLKNRMYKGVAIINAFGTPDQPNITGKKPVILASHRFGYVWWTPAYRRTHSFHNIDKLKKGDTIYIRWKAKWYRYKVQKQVISATITEYSHDLILYSCISYTSKKRIIIYADKF